MFLAAFLVFAHGKASTADEGFAAKTFHLQSVGGWVVTPDTKTLIVSVPTMAEIVFFNTVSLHETKRFKVPFQPASLALQGNRLFVAGKGSSYVHAIDFKSGKVTGRIAINGEPIQSLNCHPQDGPLYAAGTDEAVHAIDFETDTAVKTGATGEYLRVDPKDGRFLLAGTNHPSRDVIEFAKTAGDRVQLQFLRVTPTAFVQKFAITKRGLELVDLNTNAAVGASGYLGISPDGMQYAFVAGGGWRSPSNQQHHINIPVFETKRMGTMQGGLDVGAPQVIAFHPVLKIGVAQGRNYDYYIFDSQSLTIRQKITIMPGGPVNFWHNMLVFVGNGTRIASLQGEHLHIIEFELNKAEREQLQRSYGRLPNAVAKADGIPKQMSNNPPAKPSTSSKPKKPASPPSTQGFCYLQIGDSAYGWLCLRRFVFSSRRGVYAICLRREFADVFVASP